MLFARRRTRRWRTAQKALDSGNPHVDRLRARRRDGRVHAASCARSEPATTSSRTCRRRRRSATRRASRGWRSARTTTTSATAKRQLARRRKTTPARVHVGADDNASGIGRGARGRGDAGASSRARGTSLVGFWSGEELGLIGSAAFATAPPVPLDRASRPTSTSTWSAACRTTSSPSRRRGTSPVWAKIIEQANVAAGFDLRLQPDPYQPTDVATLQRWRACRA